ncbi:hypothetical protein Y032_0031g2319 [Ancylostoma ceylanicum]|uniref:Uncharacterized protein n=1 Tax=Ancylostoma ceylanicum TaxID=53326 RepID=A0A016UQS3_9BILA|nr:hypothetical protein Y032_0031g2319 [Ancylostoma ceylanicum]
MFGYISIFLHFTFALLLFVENPCVEIHGGSDRSVLHPCTCATQQRYLEGQSLLGVARSVLSTTVLHSKPPPTTEATE